MLAMFGLSQDGRPYVHVRVFKQHRVYADMLVRQGELELICRECFRWHRITFVVDSKRPVLAETVKPPEVDGSGTIEANTDEVRVA